MCETTNDKGFKVGDTVVILRNGADCANIKKGDKGIIESMFCGGYMTMINGKRLVFSEENIELVEGKIAINFCPMCGRKL